MDNAMQDCWTCRSNAGFKRISPGPTIYTGQYWLVEHAYPVSHIGWVVLVLKRHAEALHELSAEEFMELGQLQARLTQALFALLHCEKEYLACYAEADHFHHIHFHLFAKPADLPAELKGSKSFAIIKVSEAEALPPVTVAAFCEQLRAQLEP